MSRRGLSGARCYPSAQCWLLRRPASLEPIRWHSSWCFDGCEPYYSPLKFESLAMRYEDTKEQYSKVVRGWNARYDLNEFIAQHGLQPLAARELFAKFGPYKVDLDRKVAELRKAWHKNR